MCVVSSMGIEKELILETAEKMAAHFKDCLPAKEEDFPMTTDNLMKALLPTMVKPSHDFIENETKGKAERKLEGNDEELDFWNNQSTDEDETDNEKMSKERKAKAPERVESGKALSEEENKETQEGKPRKKRTRRCCASFRQSNQAQRQSPSPLKLPKPRMFARLGDGVDH